MIAVVLADRHTAASETILDDRVARAARHARRRREVRGAVYPSIGRTEQHVAAVRGDFNVLHRSGTGNAVDDILAHHAILDVADALDAAIPDAIGHIGVSDQCIGRAPVAAIKESGIRALDPGPAGTHVGGTVNAIAAEAGTTNTADAIELRAGTDIDIAIPRHRNGSHHGGRETGDALPVVTLVP